MDLWFINYLKFENTTILVSAYQINLAIYYKNSNNFMISQSHSLEI
ncbi:hypothetical protein pb186bvf_018455 [Paramecium bursaria]